MNAIQNITQTSENLTNELVSIIQSSYNEQNYSGSNGKTTDTIKAETQFGEKEVKAITEKLENTAASLNFDLDFQVHKKTGKIFVKVVDKNTHKVIKEIPSESMLDFLSKFEDAIGALFDGKS
jgi:flagellar protein FlaG